MKQQLSTILFCLLSCVVFCQFPKLQWQKIIGGSFYEEVPVTIIQTLDKGFLIAGNTMSNDGDVTANRTEGGIGWLVKLNYKGEKEWDKAFGNDKISSALQTKEGGYLLLYDSLILQANGSVERREYYLAEINFNGDFTYQRKLQNKLNLIATSASKKNIAVSNPDWFERTKKSESDSSEIQILEIDRDGNIVLLKSLISEHTQFVSSIQPTKDGGYILSGLITTNKRDQTGNQLFMDGWLAKIDSIGNLAWRKTISRDGLELFNSAIQTKDGGYIATGFLTDSIAKIELDPGNKDAPVYINYIQNMWVVKFDKTGNLIWEKSLGGSGYDHGVAILEEGDNSFLIVGSTNSNDKDVTNKIAPAYSLYDNWLVKLDKNGNKLFASCFGGDGRDDVQSVVRTQDGGFVTVSITSSGIGAFDYLVQKFIEK